MFPAIHVHRENKFGIADNINTASLSIESTFSCLVNLTFHMVDKMSIQFGKNDF